MKKWCLFLCLCMMLCLLAGCAAGEVAAPSAVSEAPPAQSLTEKEAPKEEATIRCRVVTGAEEDTLLLAELEGSGVFTLSTKDLTVTRGGAEWAPGDSLKNGDLVTVGYDGTIMEAYPGRLSGAQWMDVENGGRDDLGALYLRVLEDLWAVDSALNSNITMVGMDLSATSLSGSERAAVGWAFAQNHGVELVEGTWQELRDAGYIDGENLYWEDGCHFSITEKPMEGVYSLRPVTFDAQKWRSGLGAYFFCDCTSVQSALGQWDGYAVGAEAIS